jgi:hypothetical protein
MQLVNHFLVKWSRHLHLRVKEDHSMMQYNATIFVANAFNQATNHEDFNFSLDKLAIDVLFVTRSF